MIASELKPMDEILGYLSRDQKKVSREVLSESSRVFSGL